MKKILAVLLSMALFTQPLMASEFVVGPSTGAVFGPSESSGSALAHVTTDVKLKHNDDDAKFLDYYAFKVDEQDGKLACTYKPEQMKAGAITSSIERLAMLSYTMPFLEDPTRAKPVLNPGLSESVDMFTATETLSASQLSANEVKMNENARAFIERCEKFQSNESATSQLQLFTQGCMIYQVVKLLSELNADSDTITQKTIELNTVLNQAIAENSVREEKISQAKQKVAEVNKELQTAIDKLKKAKEDLKKAKADMEKANESLKSAQSIACSKKDDGSEDCTDRDAAVASATAAKAKAQEAVDKAEKDVKKTADALLELLKTKFNHEATTILALLSGTIKGTADGKDVTFKVNDKDFTLVDSDAAIAELISGRSYHEHWGKFKEENPNGTEEDFKKLVAEGNVNNYFSTLAQHLDNSKNEDKKYYDIWGGETSRVQANMMNTGIYHNANQETVTGAILDKFSTMGGEGDNILSIASAMADYQQYAGQQNMAQMQGMKTPQSRINEVTRKIEQLNQTNKGIRELIANNICILDMLLNQYKQTYNTLLEKKAADKPDPYLNYIYKFSSAPFSQKLKEGYASRVDLKKILMEFECYALGKGGKCLIK